MFKINNLHISLKRTFFATSVACVTLGGLAAVARAANSDAGDKYPARPLRIIVPQSAGGSTDLVARPLAKKLAEALGQSVVVDNRTGAGGNVNAGSVSVIVGALPGIDTATNAAALTNGADAETDSCCTS